MSRPLMKQGQAFAVYKGVRSFLVIIVVIIRRKNGVLAGAHGLMDRIVSAATAETSKGAMTFGFAPIVRISAMGRRLSAAYPR